MRELLYFLLQYTHHNAFILRGSNIVGLPVCTSATGSFISSLMNFCTEGMPIIISPEELPRHRLQIPSGLIKTEMIMDWCEHFVSVAKPSHSHLVLLILDGHFDHT